MFAVVVVVMIFFLFVFILTFNFFEFLRIAARKYDQTFKLYLNEIVSQGRLSQEEQILYFAFRLF